MEGLPALAAVLVDASPNGGRQATCASKNAALARIGASAGCLSSVPAAPNRAHDAVSVIRTASSPIVTLASTVASCQPARVAERGAGRDAARVGEQLEGLAACALAYGQAVQDLASQQPGTDPETLRRSEAVLAARVSLFRCLVDAGWEPTKDVRQEMSHDLRLLAEPSRERRGGGLA